MVQPGSGIRQRDERNRDMNGLAKKLVCVQMRSGVEIWMESERAENLQLELTRLTSHKFVKYDDQIINTADIVGIFTAGTMTEHTRRKNGQWQCARGNWHERAEKCYCISRLDQELIQRRDEAIKNCKRHCNRGWLTHPEDRNMVTMCDCIRDLKIL